MQQRFGQLQKYFQSGVIGLTTDGLVAVRDQNAVPLAERAVVTRLVTEDNRDRETLYAELAKANKHPEWEPDIRRTFARRWVERGAQVRLVLPGRRRQVGAKVDDTDIRAAELAPGTPPA